MRICLFHYPSIYLSASINIYICLSIDLYVCMNICIFLYMYFYACMHICKVSVQFCCHIAKQTPHESRSPSNTIFLSAHRAVRRPHAHRLLGLPLRHDAQELGGPVLPRGRELPGPQRRLLLRLRHQLRGRPDGPVRRPRRDVSSPTSFEASRCPRASRAKVVRVSSVRDPSL